MPICTNKDVFRFEVAVDDTGCMQALDTFDYLRGVKPGTIPT